MAASNESIFIAKGFDQVAFVVEDLEPATKLYSDLFGVERWSIWSDLAKDQVNKTYRGEPGDFQFSCAYGYAGDILIELCHHDGGKSVYKDWLDTRGAGIHHVGFRVVDANEFAEVERLYGKQGIEAAMGGELTDVGRYIYFDTVDRIGCYTEIYHVTPAVAEMFERMKRGEVVEGPR